MKSSKERSAKNKKELFWARFQNFKDGFHLILMLKQANLKANRRNLETLYNPIMQKAYQGASQGETVVKNTIKVTNKTLQDQAQIKLIEIFNDFFSYICKSILFYVFIMKWSLNLFISEFISNNLSKIFEKQGRSSKNSIKFDLFHFRPPNTFTCFIFHIYYFFNIWIW